MSAGLYTAEDWARFFEIHAEHGRNVTVDAAQALKIAAFLRASDVAEEPEWEYGVRLDSRDCEGHTHRWPTLAMAEDQAALNPEHAATYWKRTPAGPWVPVKQEGESDGR